MPVATLFYRTPTTKSSSYTVAQLIASFPGQCLQFIFPEEMLEGITLDEENNIISQPSPTNDGTRFIRHVDNGEKSFKFRIYGNFQNTSPSVNLDIQKLQLMKNQLNSDTYHVFGNLGFYSPNAERFSFDCNNIYGFMIEAYHIERVSRYGAIYDFFVDLSLGGTIPVL
jgi:hypothetical protein